ncbi:HpcH/HpaI aldolase/citrate lyase family protein [Ruegeria atlantica]|uniref:HpcH/HpaI aldolase/citrate lyase family protein n=1 Tax=Ruegeria atlantica TaxID=81569 RepID=UPI00147BB21A|nr:CoA ester lyase [Ruegeria atlantica]
MVACRPLIAPLFVPATRVDRIAKAAASGADAIIVDLEDAVPPQDKDNARDGLATAVFDFPVPIFLRVNSRSTTWFENDLDLAQNVAFSGIMLPKTECSNDLEHVASRLGDEFPLVALVETAVGLANLSEISKAKSLLQVAFGSIDYALDLNCSDNHEALTHARSEIVLRSRVADLPAPLDGVTTDFSDPTVLADDCTYAAGLGFGGKLAIHPRQIPVIQKGFSPSPETLDWARRVVEADSYAEGAAVQVDGRMIDRPIAEKARRILEAHG